MSKEMYKQAGTDEGHTEGGVSCFEHCLSLWNFHLPLGLSSVRAVLYFEPVYISNFWVHFKLCLYFSSIEKLGPGAKSKGEALGQNISQNLVYPHTHTPTPHTNF